MRLFEFVGITPVAFYTGELILEVYFGDKITFKCKLLWKTSRKVRRTSSNTYQYTCISARLWKLLGLCEHIC